VYLAVQFLSLSCEVFRSEILTALTAVCRPRGIYERSDASVRELEGLEKKSGWISGSFDSGITIRENGILLKIDLAEGQKTGYFLDQKDNRRVVAALAKGRRVFDAFTHTGAFGLNAVKGGAKHVVAADISEAAVRMTNENIALNNAGGVMEALCADVFDLLRSYEAAGTMFDMIILDPPAFAKKAGTADSAFGGYKDINLRAMKLLSPGGILVTCSCSSFFDAALFYSMLVHAATDAKRRVQILEKRGAGSDHPVLLGYPQSEYLKCAVLRVL
jgi:23S rRNA (cytosine1962-C5)-methyltransferase